MSCGRKTPRIEQQGKMKTRNTVKAQPVCSEVAIYLADSAPADKETPNLNLNQSGKPCRGTNPAAFEKHESQAVGSIKFCADGGSSDKTRTRRRFVRKSNPTAAAQPQALNTFVIYRKFYEAKTCSRKCLRLLDGNVNDLLENGSVRGLNGEPVTARSHCKRSIKRIGENLPFFRAVHIDLHQFNRV